MKKRIAAFLMCVICLLSVVGCGQTKADTNNPSAANQQTVADDYLTTISGTYVELFPELSKADYRSIWHDATAPLVGDDNADAAEKYTADPDSMAFDCYFLGGVAKFVMDGHKITGLDAQGKEVFSHTYRLLDKENENGFIFYQSEDENSGEFTYFAFSSDTMATTYHLEFRYAEDLNDLESWFEGNYAYWNASAIAEDYDQETLKNVITLFVTENLSESK